MEMSLLTRWFLLLLAGGLGAIGRYALSTWGNRLWGEDYPWGILCVNLAGCFLFGFLFVWFTEHSPSALGRIIFLTGFLGAFTTFSTFMFDTVILLEQGRHAAALSNLCFHNLLGIVMIYAGFLLARTTL
ncbi:MAG: fluoride efflux transporter CrcB [Planctomycetia bacterium]|nr:fluoride efflux transporter CrcB [Planctomycetia bacterium]